MRFVLLMLIYLPSVYLYGRNDENALINDFILRQGISLKVTLFICWTKAATVQFHKQLNEMNISSVILNIRNVTFPVYTSANDHLLIMDVDCEGYEQVLKTAEEIGLLKYPFRWLILSNSNIFTNTSTFHKLKFGTDSLFYLSTKTKDKHTIEAPYKIHKDGQLLSNSIGVWKKNLGFEYFHPLVIARNRTNLNLTLLRISLVILNPDSLNHFWDYRNTHVDTLSKINYVLVNFLMDMLNATRHFIVQNTWGYRNSSNSTFNGMMGDIQRGLADLGGTSLYMSKDRLNIIEYVGLTSPTIARFIFRDPPLSNVKNVFTLSFHSYVWMSSFFLLALAAVILYFAVLLERRYYQYVEKSTAGPNPLTANFSDIIMFEIGQICQQGADTEPKSIAGRTTVIFLMICLMFMYISYSANIVALLQSTSGNIRTVEDLLKSRIKIGVEDIAYNHFFFAAQTKPVNKAVYEQKVLTPNGPPNYMTLEKGIAKMRSEFFAFHVELGRGYKVVSDTFQEHEKCGLTEMEFLQLPEPWLPIKKDSPYKEPIKVALKKIYESGVERRELRRLYTKKPECTGTGSNFMSVGIIDSYYVFLLFGTGVFASLSCLVLEIITYKYLKRRKNNLNKNLRELPNEVEIN